nr:PREDICTED: odorant receptor Or1 isoform X4 [Tribolium castaneum]|eukprot:XP_015833042.1 PREDICTED: odorant receptor Or1 isoform X4 [Tribolium castaneum]
MYSENKFDFVLTIKPNILFLKIVGLWPVDNNDVYRIYTLIVTVFFMGVFDFTRIMNIFFVYTDLKVLTATIYLTVTDITVLVKTCLFMSNIKTLKRLIVTINCDVFQPKTDHQKQLVQSGLKAWKVSYMVFWSLVFCCLVMWTVSPIIQATPAGRKPLPLPAWYPYNTDITPFYEITYVCQVISMWFLATANMNMDSLIAALMIYVGAQCDILSDNLKKMKTFSKIKEEQAKFNQTLIDRIEHHKKILQFAYDCNASYNFIILAQFFTSSLAIALSMFQLTLVDPLSMESFPLLSYAFGMALQIFLYCWFGNEVEAKSSKIPYSAFESDWTGAPIEAKKNLLIFILRTQKPIKMSAINLFSLSLETFTTILRTSWSYFAVLRQVNGQA